MATTPQPTPDKPTLKERAAHELKNYAFISAYLFVLFSALTIYTELVLSHFGAESSLSLGFCLINALVIGKVILLGEMFHLGQSYEAGHPLYRTVLIKSGLYGLLFFAFHLVEEAVKRIIHHEPPGTVFREMELSRLAAGAVVILCAFIPLFAYRELGRILGEEKLQAIFTKPYPPTH